MHCRGAIAPISLFVIFPLAIIMVHTIREYSLAQEHSKTSYLSVKREKSVLSGGADFDIYLMGKRLIA
jgi:hypothetical protein